MPLPAHNGHGKLRGKLDHYKICPNNTIKSLGKYTTGNLESYFSKAEESQGGSAVMLPRTTLNSLPNADN